MTDRFTRARTRLENHERSIQKKRNMDIRLGKILPEDTIKVPKIGEWTLSSHNTDDPNFLDTNDSLFGTTDMLNSPQPTINRALSTISPTVSPTMSNTASNAPKQISGRMAKAVRPFPKDIPLSQEQTKRLSHPEIELISPKSKVNKNQIEAPFLIKSPVPVTEPIVNTGIGQRVQYPSGTTTTDLDSIIRSKYRAPAKPLPPLKNRGPTTSTSSLDDGESFMPLEIFDDTTFEEYPLEELMKNPDAYSRYRELSGTTYWTECKVIDYNKEEEIFTIEWLKTKKRKKVARYNLRFAIENEDLFEQRVENAKKAAKKYEIQFRFDSRVKQMPMEELPELSQNNFQEILMKMAISDTSKYNNKLQNLIEEVRYDFKYMNNQLSFEYDLEHNPLIPDRDAFLELFPPEKPPKESGLLPHIEFDFGERMRIFTKTQIYANSHILGGMQTIWGIFIDSEQLTFLTGGYDVILALDEFISRQYQELESTSRVFKGQIQETLEGVISTTMNDEVVMDRQSEKYRYAKMVMLTTRMLHMIMLTIIENTLEKYSQIFTRYFNIEPPKRPKPILTYRTEEEEEEENQEDLNEEEEEEENEAQKEAKFAKVPKLLEKVLPQFHVDLLFNDTHRLALIPSSETCKDQIISLLIQLENAVNDLPAINLPYLGLETNQIAYTDCCDLIHISRDNLEKNLSYLFAHLEHFLDQYRYLEPTLGLETESFIKEFDPEGKRSLNDYKKQLSEFYNVQNVVTMKMDRSYDIGIFKLSCASFKELSSFHTNSLVVSLLTHMKSIAIHGIKEIEEEFQMISERLKIVPQTPEELAELRKFMDQVIESTNQRQVKTDSIMQRFAFLEEYKFEISNEECQDKYHALQIPHKLSVLINDTDTMLQVERIRMIHELRQNQKQLEIDTLAVTNLLPEFIAKYQDLELTIDAVDQINEIQQQLFALKEKQDIYSNHEKLFDFDHGPCRNLTKLIEEFNPLSTLWNLAGEWLSMSTTWLDTPFPQVKPDQMNAFIISGTKKITKLKKDLSPHRELMEKVLFPLQEQIEKFKQPLPLVGKLRHPGIKTKHWEQISEIVGFNVMPSMELTLQGFIDLHLERWNDQISQIASIAAQEYNIESALDQMDEELQKRLFSTTEFRGSGQFILVDVDDIISLVDDQLVTTQTLLTSPFIAPVKKRAVERLQFLHLAHDTLEAWIECQRSWLYLQPIFTGTSIQQKLFREARDWKTVDKIWAGIMTLTHNHPDFVNVMHRDKLLENLQQCNTLLESITQGLNAYLETKRHAFPRFFFLSNDELITILSHTKDFDIIMKSMSKLFEYVNAMEVTEENIIMSMIDDGELEAVRLMNPVDGNTEEIEDWLNNFEEEMKNTLKNLIKDALNTALKKKRDQWIAEYPAQVIIITNQILWTQQMTNVLRSSKLRTMKVVQSKFIEQLDQLTEMIRQQLTPALRQLISCLLINEVHNRDIVSNLINLSVTDIDSFKWVQQLRYYWEDETVIVRSINNSYEYSYEYAGNSSRLVITPLTDRCYQTLLSAFKQFLGGAPSGPAGTGKTETVRDCAKALGRSCVVYNCSEEVTPEQMSQFFAGLSTSGSWSCFDEFNRINIEVLSVIAQQVRTIQNAIAAGVETFVLDSRTLKLNPNAAICITMNPGYAGRTELPDNLKALFRPCAMMVPDFGFIAEIMLFSGGFTTASILSVKLIALFDLCRKQLSNTHHYDWGLRAMKSILMTAGKSKRSNLETDEALLLVKAIIDCTKPRLISVDIPLFDNIIHDVFPSIDATKTPSKDFVTLIKESFTKLKCEPLKQSVSKCVELYESTLLRHGIMLVGGPMGGKSTCWKVIQMSVSEMVKNNPDFGMPILIEALNPKSISIPELYGLFDPVTSGWSDGVLSSKIRSFSMSDPTEYKWIIADGPVDSLWIESMNSLLDDNKVLCLSNNERISLGNHVKIIFEVDDLSQASPATVSRCAMIFFDPSSLIWSAITNSWIENCPKPSIAPTLKKLMTDYIPKMIQFVEVDVKPVIGSNTLFYVQNMLRILDCFMDVIRTPDVKTSDDGENTIEVDPLNHKLYFSPYCQNCAGTFSYFDKEQENLVFERIFLFSLIWSFGASLNEEGRVTFDAFIKDLTSKLGAKSHFPPKFTVFDYYVDLQKFSWLPWCDSSTGINITSRKPIEQQLIPTNESASMMFLSRLMVHHSKHVLFQGKESSKSLVVKTLLENMLDDTFDTRSLPLANCSSSSNMVKVLRSFMQKRHGAFGPLTDMKLLVFIDNLSSVRPDTYGSQPPLELIRQFFDYGGWYDTSKVEFQRVVDTTIISSMGPRGGGLFGVPERLLRHFFFINVPKLTRNSMSTIITALLNNQLHDFNPPVKELVRSTVAAFLDIFDQCTQVLLPIPSKSHYVFSLRNIVRVIKGIILGTPQDISDDITFVKLWYHEMMREFNDRFNSDTDRNWFSTAMNDMTQKHFRMSFQTLCPTGAVMFNGFADHSMNYKECKLKSDQLLDVCRDVLEDHNHEASKPLDIVLFKEAIDHISSISRVLSMPRGHMMLVGVKSSGRKSLARLAMHMSSMEPFEIQLTRTYSPAEWRDNLKTLMRQCGVSDLPTTFMISDSQIVGSYQLEDISHLLINSEIPNLFEREEIEKIQADLVQAELLTDEDPWALFTSRVKQHLHIILVFSPYGSVFKESIMYFPALRTETTIDWYMPWSSNALESVGKASLIRSNLGSENLLKSVVNVCVKIHKSVEDASQRFQNEAKRFTACTPSRYFELLSTFISRVDEKQLNTKELIENYEGGVEKIEATRQQIQALSEQLDRDIPVLEEKRTEVEEMLKDLHVKKGEVETKKQEVKAQSDIAEAEASQAAEINRVAQEKFAAAQPILKAAQDAVESMDKDSLVNIKTLKKIHPALRETFDAICIIFGRTPRRVDSNVPGVKMDDYWPETLSLVNDVQFIKKVKSYEVEKIPREIINKLKKYVGSNKKERDEKLQGVQNGYQAVANLYMWVCASYDYWFVFQEIIPKRLEAEEAAAKLAASKKVLETQKANLKAVEDQLSALQKRVDEEKSNEKALADNVGHTQLRLNRAQKIMAGLMGETKRWTEYAENLKDSSAFIIGDSLLISAALTHLGPFSPMFRHNLLEEWKRIISTEGIQFTKTFSIASYLGNDATIRDWIAKGLSNDTHSIENGLIIQNSKTSFPLLIDPQFSGTKWLQMVEGDKLVMLRFDQVDFVARMRSCISTGIPVLIENVGIKLDPIIDPILSREFMNIDGQKKIALAGEYINYSDGFRMYLSTKYPNPVYSPEVCSQVTLINFTTTPEGLSDLLMNSLIEVEREDLDRKRINLMEANAENMMKLKQIEQEILDIVSKAGQDLLDDDVATETLQSAQRMSASIEQQMAASKNTEKLINQFKQKFSLISDRAALLYFCASDFSVIDPMYQFSLKWFVNIFKQALAEAEHPQDQSLLIQSLNGSIASKFFQNVSFSLFSRHKLLFSFLLATRILMAEHHISSSELAFMLSPTPTKDQNPYDWLSDESWCLLSGLPKIANNFQDILNHISSHEAQWKTYAASTAGENEKIPLETKITPFQSLLILRVFHLHRVREGIMKFISETLGKEFVTPPPLNLTNVFKESSPTSPLIFIITPGIDPVDEVVSVADSMELGKYVKFYSLGRGRGQGAEELIIDASERGFWVMLQNCHLSLSWMPRLEHIIDHLDPAKVHNRFRLCLVTMSDDRFPIGILYSGSKLIYEIPKGIRENMLRIYSQFNADDYDKEMGEIEKQLTFNLAFFHSVVLERLQFGSIGWNIPYEFNPSDFAISRRHLKMFLAEAGLNDIIPFEALSYVIGELNYGGRVTDAWDRRLLMSLLNRFFSDSINDSTFSLGDGYSLPDYGNDTFIDVEKLLNSWPLVTAGEDVGLSPNASTITARNDALRIFNSLIEIQPTLTVASGAISEEQYLINFVDQLIKECPQNFNVFNFTKKFDLSDIINTVIHHEIILYNNLLHTIRETLATLQLGLKGMIIIDEKLDLFSHQLIANKVPDLWMKKSYPTKLTLHSYIEDLHKRIEFLDNWIRTDRPKVFKLGAFFHPEEFLTAVLQVFARKHSIPFDTLHWTTKITEHLTGNKVTTTPEDGIYVEGLLIEGAKWDVVTNGLTECRQTELISTLPVLHLLPISEAINEGNNSSRANANNMTGSLSSRANKTNSNIYECPMYRTQNRGTGALDLPNYIMSIYLPSGSENPDHWIQRSVAVFITVQM
ncbi:Dynein heavy chain family protein [Tritrichomonas foetus]|uniref:Dynein-1, subspecies f n=1 Tax=Tritrichomonas foetus TaxID=1144522 RepID=A0A1J4JZX6_9EUKA|nr:Dynein heavy chain family protein [Tritrichomonas foetus]|eukprot:OHT04040.1 Dynein heavy chain family protein [Tritrichomonas foetus]